MSDKMTQVFLSCGEHPDEIEVVNQIKAKLEAEQYRVYVALEVQNVSDLTGDIFESLRESEYLLFINFKREAIVSSATQGATSSEVHRGSLFTNQELALAKFLGLDVIPFQEEGVEKEAGIMKFIHLNPKSFTDRGKLPDDVMSEVKMRWKPGWKNQLALHRDPQESRRALVPHLGPGRWYHIEARNLHRDKLATDCLVYLTQVADHNTGRELDGFGELVEFKWYGVTPVRVAIPARNKRMFDAVYVLESQPNVAYLGINQFVTDYAGLQYRLEGPRSYDLTFKLFANGFTPVEDKFTLELGSESGGTKLYRYGETPPSRSISEATQVLVDATKTSGTTLSIIATPGTLSPLVGYPPIWND